MLDLDRDPRLRRLFNLARRRVVAGFAVAAVTFILATPTWTTLAAGAAIALIGEALRVWAAGHLVKGREVTMSGPYRWMQHPLYVGSAVLGVGFSVIAASWVVAVIVLGYVGVMTAAAIRLETATLRDAFGETYTRYVAGEVAPAAAARRFSLRRAIANREHHAVAGFAATVAVMALKAWFAAP